MRSIPPRTEEDGAGAVLSIEQLGVRFVTPQGDVPAVQELGLSGLEVVANGIASLPVFVWIY